MRIHPHALYAGALIAYLLHDTPYALSETTLHNLKQGLLTFRFFCAGLEVPALELWDVSQRTTDFRDLITWLLPIQLCHLKNRIKN